MSNRYAQLMSGSKVATQDRIQMQESNGVLSLFSIESDAVVGLYNMKYVPGSNSLNVDYLLTNIKCWSVMNDRYAIIVNIDQRHFALVEGCWFEVSNQAVGGINNDIRTNSNDKVDMFIAHLVTRVDLACQLAPLTIVETTELVIANHQVMSECPKW